jgi:hypothetical protein
VSFYHLQINKMDHFDYVEAGGNWVRGLQVLSILPNFGKMQSPIDFPKETSMTYCKELSIAPLYTEVPSCTLEDKHHTAMVKQYSISQN